MAKINYKHKHFRKNFKGENLSGKDLSYSEFIACNFTDADLSRANCSYSDFTGSILVNTKCTDTDFSHTCLACKFEPMDAYGMTLTLSCRTFSTMKISSKWWYSFLYFAMQMQPAKENDIDPRDILKEKVFTIPRFERLKKLFSTRIL